MHGVALDISVYFSPIEFGTSIYMPYDLNTHTRQGDLELATFQWRILVLNERGSAHVRLPIDRTTDREVTHDAFKVEMESSAHELDVALSHHWPIGPVAVDMTFGAPDTWGTVGQMTTICMEI